MGLLSPPFTFIAKASLHGTGHFFGWSGAGYQARSYSFYLVDSQSKVICFIPGACTKRYRGLRDSLYISACTNILNLLHKDDICVHPFKRGC